MLQIKLLDVLNNTTRSLPVLVSLCFTAVSNSFNFWTNLHKAKDIARTQARNNPTGTPTDITVNIKGFFPAFCVK